MGSRGEMDERAAATDAGSSSDSAADESKVFPVIERRYEPAPDLVDRLRFIDALLTRRRLRSSSCARFAHGSFSPNRVQERRNHNAEQRWQQTRARRAWDLPAAKRQVRRLREGRRTGALPHGRSGNTRRSDHAARRAAERLPTRRPAALTTADLYPGRGSLAC